MSIRSGHRKGPPGGSVVVCSRNVSGTSGPNVRRAVFAVQRVGSRPGGGGAGVPASNTGAVLAAKPSGGAGSEVSATLASAAGGGGDEPNSRPRSNRPRNNHCEHEAGSQEQPTGSEKITAAAEGPGRLARCEGQRPAFCGQKCCLHALRPAGLLCPVCGVTAFSLSEVLQRLVPTSVTAGAGPGEEMAASGGTSGCGGVGRVRVPHQNRRFDVLPYCELVPALFIVPRERPGEGAGGLECLLPPFPSFGRVGGLEKTRPRRGRYAPTWAVRVAAMERPNR